PTHALLSVLSSVDRLRRIRGGRSFDRWKYLVRLPNRRVAATAYFCNGSVCRCRPRARRNQTSIGREPVVGRKDAGPGSSTRRNISGCEIFTRAPGAVSVQLDTRSFEKLE